MYPFYISLEQSNNFAEHDDTKIKNVNSSGSSTGGLAISSTSACGSLESAGTSIPVSVPNTGTNIGLHNVGEIGDISHIKNNNNITPSLGQATDSNDVDEDGYSIQPPKEVAWEEHNENGKPIRTLDKNIYTH